jgi:hypothetical protein
MRVPCEIPAMQNTPGPPDSGLMSVGTISTWIHRSELSTVLERLAPSTRARAVAALCDIEGDRHCTYDPNLRRAYCFQRRGLEFVFQYWDDIGTEAAANSLFARLPNQALPLPIELARSLARDAVGR